MRARRHGLLVGLSALILLPTIASAAIPIKEGDKSELGGLPRFQQALKRFEEAKAYLEIATQRSASEMREPARQAADEADAAINAINAILDKHNVGRDSQRGTTDPTKVDQPIPSARESLDAAWSQLDSVHEKFEVEARGPKARARKAVEILDEAKERREREQAKLKEKKGK